MRPFGSFGLENPAASTNVYSGAKNRENFYRPGKVALPAIGSQAVIAQQPIFRGRNGVLWKVGVDYVGAGFVEGSGAILFSLFRDAALSRTVKGFANLTASMGSVNNPLEIPGEDFIEGEVISLVVKNVSLAVGGAQCIGALVGWTFPKNYTPRGQWGM